MAVGGFPLYIHERIQLDQLATELHATFQSTAERVRLVINVIVEGEQVDALLFKNGGLVVIEAKDWGGRISANFQARNWTVHSEKTNPRVPSPMPQVDRKRLAVSRAIAKFATAEVREVAFLKEHIRGWVVTRLGSKPTPTGLEDSNNWFDVMSVSDVARVLRTDGPPAFLSENDFSRLVETVGAKQSDLGEWIHRGSQYLIHSPESTQDPEQIRVPKIDSWVQSTDPSMILRALDFIRDLELRAYATELMALASHPSLAVQREALELMILWRPVGFRERIAECVEHPDGAIKRAVLELATREPFPEAIPGLARLAGGGKGPDVQLAIQGLAVAGVEAAKKPLLRLFSRWAQRRTDLGDFPLEVLVRAVGKARLTGSIQGLLSMLEWKEFRGSRAGGEPYDSMRETVLISLGMIGGNRAKQALVSELQANKRTLSSVLGAIAELGDPELAETVLPYIKSEDAEVRSLAFRALRKMRSPVAFEPLFGIWRDGLSRGEGRLDAELEEALIAIDPRRLEQELPTLVSRYSGQENLHRIWRIWDKVLSSESRDLLLRLLERDDTALDASAFLVRIADADVINRAKVMLSARSAVVRAAAVWLLAYTLGPSEISQVLDDLARDDGPEVRVAVVGAFARLPDNEALPKILAFATDSSREVRDYCFAILGRHATAWQPRAGWASSGIQRGNGRVFLLPTVLVIESDATTGIMSLDRVMRVGSCATLGPGGTLYLVSQTDGRAESFVICLEADPFDLRLSFRLDSLYEAVVDCIQSLRGRRTDLGPRGLSPEEGERARDLVGKVPSWRSS